MRIAQCSDSFLPIAGMTERAVYEYARAFANRSHESYVIAPMGEAGYRARYPFEIVDFMSVRVPGLSRYRTGVAVMDRHYMARVDGIELDIVHAHSPGFSGLEAARLADTLKIPLVGTFHGHYHEEILKSVRGEALAPLAMKYIADFYDRCDEVWAVSEEARDELISCGYEGSIRIIGYGEDGTWEDIADAALERYDELCGLERFKLTRKRGLFRKELSAVDRSLEMRKVSLIRQFLRQDMQNIYSYTSSNPQEHDIGMGESTTLLRAAPEDVGMRPRDLLGFFHSVDADTDAGVQSMLVLRRGRIIAEGYWSPYKKENPHMLFSMSKSITSTAIGLLVDEKKLMLTQRLLDIFADKVDNPQEHPMKDVTVWHLLTMSTGARFDEVGTALGSDWVQEFLDSGVRFEPGTRFYYNSMNTYMLSAIVKRVAGVNMLEYLNERLFSPLGIMNASWELCPMGIEKGGWGLSLTLEDAAKIGLLYLNMGVWKEGGQELRILSREWIAQATDKQIDTPDAECVDGYGYQIWMAPRKGAYLFNGAFGQYLLIMPEYEALVAVFSGSARLFAKGGLMAQAERCFMNAQDLPVVADKAEGHMLKGALESLTLLYRQGIADVMPMPVRWLAPRITGVCRFDKNICGVMPFVLQCLHNVFALGVSSIQFAGDGGVLHLNFTEGDDEYELYARDGSFTYGQVTVRGETHAVSTGAVCGLTDEGAAVLRLYVYFLTTPCTRIITFRFEDKNVSVEYDENPSAKDAAAMLMELAGITRTELFRALVPFLKHERLENQLREFAVTRVFSSLEQ